MGFDKKFWVTTFTLTGTITGAGILGLPYVFSRSGMIIGLGWLIVLGLIMGYTTLCLGEVSLRTRGNHQLPGYARKYLGKRGELAMFFIVIFGVYSALLAYIIGEGESFSQIFTGGPEYSIYCGIGFWLIMTLLLREGLRGLKKIEMWGVTGIIAIVVLLTVHYFPEMSLSNHLYYNVSNLYLPLGVVLFALMGFTSIPELRLEIKGSENKMKKAIIYGVAIPVILYILFSAVFVGVLGVNVPQIATLGFGNLVSLLGIFTMLTSYFVLSFSLRDIFRFDIKLSSFWNFILVSVVPLVLFLFDSFFDLLNFVEVLGIGGVITGGLSAIMILIIGKEAKKQGKRKPEYEIPINWIIIILLSVIFFTGIILEIF